MNTPTATREIIISNPQLTLGISFPPVEDPEELAFTLAQLNELEIRHIRIAEDWALREPVSTDFNWEPLDERLSWAVRNDVSILLTIQSNGPDWACRPANQNERSCVFSLPERFQDYLETLLARYPNQFDKIQFGNEWLAEYWFPGSGEEFTAYHNMVYDTVRQLSPQSLVVLGGLSTDHLRRIAFCDGEIEEYFTIDGEKYSARDQDYCDSEDYRSFKQRFIYVIQNANYDLIDLHFYDDVELWPAYFRAVISYFPAGIPVVVSEFGGPNLFWEQPYSDRFQAARLAEYITTLNEMGVSEAYFFKLLQSDSAHPSHRESGLFRERDGQLMPKPAFYVFQQFSVGD